MPVRPRPRLGVKPGLRRFLDGRLRRFRLPADFYTPRDRRAINADMSRPTALDAGAGVTGATPAFPFLYQALRSRPGRARALVRSHRRGRGAPARARAVHHRGESPQLSRRHRAGVAVPEPIAFLVMPRVWRATPLHPLLPPAHRLDPARTSTRPDVGALRRALAHARARAAWSGSSPRGRSACAAGSSAACPVSRCSRCARACRWSRRRSAGTYEALDGPAAATCRGGVRWPCGSGHRVASRATARGGRAARAPQVTRRIMDDIAALLASEARPRSRAAAQRRRQALGRRFGAAPIRPPSASPARSAFDRRLWPHDIAGSVAWARALARAGLLTDAERDAIVARPGRRPRASSAGGTFPFRPELEDIHIERGAAAPRAGGPGRRQAPHRAARATTRSRSTSGCTSSEVVARVGEGSARVQRGAGRARRRDGGRADARLHAPAARAAHRARPPSARLRVHAAARPRAVRRLRAPAPTCCRWAPPRSPAPPSRSTARRSPAISASPRVTPNSLDAVSDRDYVLEFLAAAAITGMHLSRLAADLTLWATAEFGFVEFSDAFATGSSIMPQKKNPDVAELIRGKSGRLYGNLVAVLTTMKGLPLAYNSDMQEDKEPFFDSRRHAGGDPRRAAADAGLAHLPHRAHARARPARTSRRRPTWPTTSCARACRSARRTRSWARSSATRSSAA